MSNTFNKTIIIGRLGHDPEFKQTDKTEYTRFSLSNNTIHDGQESVQWHSVCAFGKQAQLCHRYLHKGDLCCIEGHLDSHGYIQNGEKRYAQTIVAERITFLSSRRKSENQETQIDDCFPTENTASC